MNRPLRPRAHAAHTRGARGRARVETPIFATSPQLRPNAEIETFSQAAVVSPKKPGEKLNGDGIDTESG